MRHSIGLLVIATRQYRDAFLGSFLTNNLPKFFPDDDVEVHLFSEAPWPHSVTWHQIEPLTFPKVTLLRYHAFLGVEDDLLAHDYLYYLDVDSRLERTIGREVLPPERGIVALHHTGFATGSGAWETRTGCSGAAVGPLPPVYFMGGFNGGNTREYLGMAAEIAAGVDEDNRRGVLAVWHDESWLNWYLASHPPALVLPQGFSGREGYAEWSERSITWLAKDWDRIRA